MIHGPKPAEIRLRPSRYLLLWILVIHSAVIVTVLIYLNLSLSAVGLALMIAIGAWWSVHDLRTPRWIGLKIAEGEWSLVNAAGPQSVTLRWFYHLGPTLILNFRGTGLAGVMGTTVAVLPDSASDDELTQLRHRLLIGSNSSNKS